VRASISLGRIFGIPIGLHYSWFIIAGLITLSLTGEFSATNPGWGSVVIWSAALATAALFFASILVHELSHALVARTYRLPVRSITLFALGGVAQIQKDAESARSEFWIAIAGPLTSLAIGFGCLTLAGSMGWTYETGAPGVAAAMLGWLGYINVALAIFNMIPGYPLDGGRVLRSILWGLSGNGERATRLAARIGQVVAVLFIAYGVIGFFLDGSIGELWIAFIGWFLFDASRSSQAQAALVQRLHAIQVGDLMERDAWPPPAADGAELDGAVSPETTADEALAIMVRWHRTQLPVVDHGRLVGLVTRNRILQLVHMRTVKS
jgi:Zn-dependent protease